MNDFTKEELEAILTCITGGIRHNIKADKLRDKIQSMVDNYCEPKQIDGFIRHITDYTECNHDWHELELIHPATPTIVCVKCRAIHFVRDKNDNQ